MARGMINELTAFGLAVKTQRQKAGFSQEQLAAISGLNRTYIGSIERGERNIGLQNVFVLAAALNISASDLLRATERIHKHTESPGA